MKKNTILLLLLVCSINILSAQFPAMRTAEQLQASPSGANILRYFDLLNQGEPLTETMIRQLYAESLLTRYEPADLISMMEDVRQQDGQLALYEVIEAAEHQYELLIKSLKNGRWMRATMTFEQQSPFALAGFGIHSDATASSATSPVYMPARRIDFENKPTYYAAQADIASQADELAHAYADMNWFSGVMLLAKDGKPFFEKAYGMADIGRGVPNTMETKFVIGSINKDYTAVLVLQQVQHGRLSLDDKLSQFHLGFPAATAERITVRQLLQHTSGFGDIFIPAYLEDVRRYKTIDDMLPLLRDEPLAYEPGTDKQYSNYGYIVLGAILEKITGQPFRQLLDENIHAVTGCNNTHYATAEAIQGEAKSYRFTVTGEKEDHTSALEIPHPDGGMYATAADLLQFFQVLFYTGQLLTDPYKVLFLNHFEPSDQSWPAMLADSRGAQGYAGGGPGVSALVGVMLKDNYTAIVLANTDGDVAEEIGQRLQSVFRGRPYPKPVLLPANVIYDVYRDNGIDHVVTHFAQLTRDAGYGQPDSDILNGLGYSLMRAEKVDQALDIFTANVQLFPNDANPYDSLAEAWLRKGDKQQALTWYRKALEIDPDFPSARRAVRELTMGATKTNRP